MNDESQRWRADRARDYLEHVRGLSRSLESRQQEIEALRSMLLPQGTVYTGMPGSPNAYGDAIPDGIARLQELVESYCGELAECIAEVERAHRIIGELPDGRHGEILRLHYLCGRTWEQCAVSIGYSWSQTQRLRVEALRGLFDKLPPEWRVDLPEAV